MPNKPYQVIVLILFVAVALGAGVSRTEGETCENKCDKKLSMCLKKCGTPKCEEMCQEAREECMMGCRA